MSFHKKILLVDDDSDDQEFFMEALKELEPTLECSIANNGLEALEYLSTNPPPPSLIFLDLNMPNMNGFECLAELSKVKQYKDIPVIILTTSNDPENKERSLKMGARVFLTKVPGMAAIKFQLHEMLEKDFTVAN
ncbi:MAG: response regulator [Bacteroidota bacterium]